LKKCSKTHLNHKVFELNEELSESDIKKNKLVMVPQRRTFQY